MEFCGHCGHLIPAGAANCANAACRHPVDRLPAGPARPLVLPDALVPDAAAARTAAEAASTAIGAANTALGALAPIATAGRDAALGARADLAAQLPVLTDARDAALAGRDHAHQGRIAAVGARDAAVAVQDNLQSQRRWHIGNLVTALATLVAVIASTVAILWFVVPLASTLANMNGKLDKADTDHATMSQNQVNLGSKMDALGRKVDEIELNTSGIPESLNRIERQLVGIAADTHTASVAASEARRIARQSAWAIHRVKSVVETEAAARIAETEADTVGVSAVGGSSRIGRVSVDVPEGHGATLVPRRNHRTRVAVR